MDLVKCEVCGKFDQPIVVCGAFGAYSYNICIDCLTEGKEPYKNMVAYISCAGRFPEDINETYQKLVREQLKLHNITEDQFIHDVDIALEEEKMLWKHMNETSYDPHKEF